MSIICSTPACALCCLVGATSPRAPLQHPSPLGPLRFRTVLAIRRLPCWHEPPVTTPSLARPPPVSSSPHARRGNATASGLPGQALPYRRPQSSGTLLPCTLRHLHLAAFALPHVGPATLFSAVIFLLPSTQSLTCSLPMLHVPPICSLTEPCALRILLLQFSVAQFRAV